MWSLPYAPHPDYAQFKGMVYGQVDPLMQRFFPPPAKTEITVVYCTLCGTVIPYDSLVYGQVAAVRHQWPALSVQQVDVRRKRR